MAPRPHLDWENDKPTVLALREIAAGLVGPEILTEADPTPADLFTTEPASDLMAGPPINMNDDSDLLVSVSDRGVRRLPRACASQAIDGPSGATARPWSRIRAWTMARMLLNRLPLVGRRNFGLRQLLARLSYLPQDQLDKIVEAYDFSASAHEGQKRRSGEAYITHPVAVASILVAAAPRLPDDRGGAAARRDRGHAHRQGRDPDEVRRGSRRPGGRRQQARPAVLHEPRRGAGGELPQDDARDGGRTSASSS